MAPMTTPAAAPRQAAFALVLVLLAMSALGIVVPALPELERGLQAPGALFLPAATTLVVAVGIAWRTSARTPQP